MPLLPRLRRYALLSLGLILPAAWFLPAGGQTGATNAQTVHAGPSPVFEVASVRSVAASGRGPTQLGPYGTSLFSFRNASLRNLLQLAYNTDQMEGTPKGFEEAYFDVEAKTDADRPLTYELLKPMLQQLLHQRFGLIEHMTVKQVQGLGLVVAKGGPRLTSASPGADSHAYILTNRLEVVGGTLATLAGVLSGRLHQPVVDLTGLPGKYDVTLKFAPEDSTDSPDPAIYTAVKEQLGLELKPHAVSVQGLVIDHLDLTPTAN